LLQISTCQPIKDEIIYPFPDKDEVFAIIRKTGESGSYFFIHFPEEDGTGLFRGVFSRCVNGGFESKFGEEVADNSSEK
jgi:hypothetical protein